MYGRSITSCTSNDGPPASTLFRLQLPSIVVIILRLAGALLVLVAAPAFTELTYTTPQQNQVRGWPSIAAETRPWTRWWWQGSAVEGRSLSAQLQALAAAGIGGVEITPIYGVRGAEDRFIPYLSPQWMAMLDYTLREAARLKLGVDMATGTGWPFGGPWVGDDTAPRSLVHKTWTLTGGERLTEPVTLRQTPFVRAIGNQIHIVNEGAPGDPPRGAATQAPVIRPEARAIEIADLVEPVSANRNLQALALEQVKYPRDLPLTLLMAYSDAGDALDLTSRVQADGSLDWMAPSGRWSLYAIFAGWHGKLVERAAPGGEGNVIDHFSADAIGKYLLPFDRAFKGHSLDGLRAFFNDSYEVDDATGEADWTPRLLEEFEKRRGYDLRQHLPQLLGKGTDDVSARVLADYRETISDLLLDTFTTEWASWARRHGRQVRNQAHGSPASILDLYAASDMPETEGAEIQRFKWATSAAHVAGRRLVSAEAATWLGEHFRVRLAEVKAAVDQFFVAGVNHIVYHGTAYSPLGDAWPGWQFYASVEFNPQNAWWDDFAALNAYVARVQSFLQSGRPDTDVLVYYPFYESLTVRGPSLLSHFGGAAPPSRGTTFEKAAETLQAAGFTYDFVSDRQLTPNANRERPGHDRRRDVIPDGRAARVSLRSSRNRAADSGARARRRNGRVVGELAVRRQRPGRSRRQARAVQGRGRRRVLWRGRWGRHPRSGDRPRSRSAGHRSRPPARARRRAARADGRSRSSVRTARRRAGPRLLRQQSTRPRDRRMGAARQPRCRGDGVRSNERPQRWSERSHQRRRARGLSADTSRRLADPCRIPGDGARVVRRVPNGW